MRYSFKNNFDFERTLCRLEVLSTKKHLPKLLQSGNSRILPIAQKGLIRRDGFGRATTTNTHRTFLAFASNERPEIGTTQNTTTISEDNNSSNNKNPKHVTPIDRIQKFQKMHEKLMKVPLQQYTPQLWNQGKSTLYFWMSELSQEVKEGQEIIYKPIAKHEKVHVGLCLELLDHWVMADEGPPDGVFEGTNTDLLNQIVNRWRVAWNYNQTRLTPEQMLEKLKSYLQSSKWVQIDTKTLNMIIDAAGNGNNASWDHKKAPIFAEGVLEKMEQDYGLTPTAVSFASVIHAWAKSGLSNAPIKAEALLQKVEQSETIQPNNILYCAVVDTWVKSSHPEAIERAESLIREMETCPLSDVFPNTDTISCLLNGLALRAPHQRGYTSRALGILRTMIQEYEQDSSTPRKPNQQCFCSVITAFGRSGQTQEAQRVLDEMQSLYERTKDPDFCPDAWCYSAILDAWAKQGNIEQAKSVIRQMQDTAESTGDTSIKVTNVDMNALLHGMAREQKMNRGRRGENDIVERAFAILGTMEDLYQNENRVEMKPDIVSYGAVIDCIAKSNRRDAAEQCEALLRRLQEKVDAGDLAMRPNATIYSIIVNAWSRSPQPNAPDRAEALVQEMKDTAKRTGDSDMKPTRHTYTALLTAWARSKRSDALDKAQAVFEEFSKNYRTTDLEYRALLNAWANRGDVAHMERLLQKMLKDYYQSRKEDSVNKNTEIVPCTKSFNLLLSAYSKSGIVDAGRRAESLLVKMQQLHVKDGLSTQPDSISLGSVLHSWGRSRQKGAAEHAEKILRHSLTLPANQKMKPNTICFNSVIHAWAKCKEQPYQNEGIAAERAEALLNEMWQRHESKNNDRSVRPDRITYTGCIAAWARSGHPHAAEKAQALLDDMLARSSNNKYSDLYPDAVVYRTVQKAWLQQGDEEKVQDLAAKVEQLSRSNHRR